MEGNEEAARDILASLEPAAAENYMSPDNRAKIHLGPGDHDKVFEGLENGFEERAVRMPYFMIDPMCDGIRKDVRFEKVAEKMGIAFDV